jgi:hypothetical protein
MYDSLWQPRGMRLPFLRGKLPKEGASCLLCCALAANVQILALKMELFSLGHPRKRDTCKNGFWKG